MLSADVTFTDFAQRDGPRLRAALVGAYGREVGLDAAAEALAYGWEHRDRLAAMANPAGYLYRVGQTAARRARRPEPLMPRPDPVRLPDVEPGLAPALETLSEVQRVCVVLVHAFGWTRADAAELLDIDESTVRTHLRRGLSKLQNELEVTADAR